VDLSTPSDKTDISKPLEDSIFMWSNDSDKAILFKFDQQGDRQKIIDH
jgi:hypothetical protein